MYSGYLANSTGADALSQCKGGIGASKRACWRTMSEDDRFSASSRGAAVKKLNGTNKAECGRRQHQDSMASLESAGGHRENRDCLCRLARWWMFESTLWFDDRGRSVIPPADQRSLLHFSCHRRRHRNTNAIVSAKYKPLLIHTGIPDCLSILPHCCNFSLSIRYIANIVAIC